MTSDPIISIRGLEVEYRTARAEVRAVRGVDLDVARGERVAIVGESGSGKSTLAHAIVALLPDAARVARGSVSVGGVELAGARDRVARRVRVRVVGLVPQDPMVSLNPTQRVGHQVAEAARLRGLRGSAVDVAVVDALSAAGIDDPEARARQHPHELSGGLRQRVLIAIALAGDPDVIVADEPTSALDVTVQKRILDRLDRLARERGIALVLITHDLGVAADRSDRIVVMSGGRVVEEGPTAAVVSAPAEQYTRRLLDAAPSRSALRPAPASADAPVLLAWRGVSRTFSLPGGGRAVAADDVSLEARAHGTLAIVGESGSGKSTLLRLALGLERPTGGAVERSGARVQFVQQNPFAALDPRFSIGRSIAEPLARAGAPRAERRARVAELLELVDLPADFAGRLPRELSGGQRQRVAIARALAPRPDLVLLDEPTSALDASVQQQVLRLLAELQASLGLGYVLVTHDLDVVAQLAHEVAVLRGGRVVERGDASRVLSEPSDPYTRELLAASPGALLRAVAIEGAAA
ncbi:ATP-binding cassette domain-containing protein [Microbacterium indicum]|uniref:ATP-binding cassette domain-containing protein n=1 Tax=Microbacterium indicum TaxID=358100 RepID=UPI0004249003|nr:ABC transporter ATP-binding protein [Microbacterium indicum]